MTRIIISRISTENFDGTSLDNFVLNQKVEKCWRMINGVYVLTSVSYTETWDFSERREMALKILCAVEKGQAAFGAVADGVTVGQYIVLSEFYVSENFRRQGIGYRLFRKVCCEAKKLGAKRLYISAHSAEESINAYMKYGCSEAVEPDRAHIEKEPFDLQLEYDLSKL